MRLFTSTIVGDEGNPGLKAFVGGELFVHTSPRNFKKGIVVKFAADGTAFRVITAGFSGPHESQPFGVWQPTGDREREVRIGLNLPVFDLPSGEMLVVDEEQGVVYEFLPPESYPPSL